MQLEGPRAIRAATWRKAASQTLGVSDLKDCASRQIYLEVFHLESVDGLRRAAELLQRFCVCMCACVHCGRSRIYSLGWVVSLRGVFSQVKDDCAALCGILPVIHSGDSSTPCPQGVYHPIKVKGFVSKPLGACKERLVRAGRKSCWDLKHE